MSAHQHILTGQYTGDELVDHVRKLVGPNDKLLDECPLCNAIMRKLRAEAFTPAPPAVTHTGK